MTPERVMDLTREVVNHIAGPYPSQKPRIEWTFIADKGEHLASYTHEDMGDKVRDRYLTINPNYWAHPDLTDDDVRFVVAHEMGHWWMETFEPDLYNEAWEERRLFQMTGYWYFLTPTTYRELKGENYADRFAATFTGLPVKHYFSIADRLKGRTAA